MADCMEFPSDWREFLEEYAFEDEERVYTNGAKLIQVLRVQQLIEHLLKEQEEKKGQWIGNVYCSECGWLNEVEAGFAGSVEGYLFCPHCGAKMFD